MSIDKKAVKYALGELGNRLEKKNRRTPITLTDVYIEINQMMRDLQIDGDYFHEPIEKTPS